MMEEKIKQVLSTVVHPETGKDIVASGFIEHTAAADGKVPVVLRFAKTRDPFAVKIKHPAEAQLRAAFPGSDALVAVKEGGAAPRPPGAPACRCTATSAAPPATSCRSRT